MNELQISFAMLRRDWRSGELRALAVALLIAVAALSSVRFFTDRLEQVLDYQANELLGADLVVTALQPLPEAWRAHARALGLQIADSRDFHSMVMASGRSRLAEVKAVSSNYPLRGQLRIRGTGYTSDRPVDTVPDPGTVWADARLVSQLGVKPGGVITVGTSTLHLAAVLTHEADRASALFSIAPRLMINLDDLPATGLIQTGSRIRYRLMIAGNTAGLEQFRHYIQPRLSLGQQLQGIEDARPEVREALDRARRFLGLSALITLALAGIAISTSTRRFIVRHLDSCAVMRCLGARHAVIVRIYAMQLLWLGLLACGAGCLTGLFAQSILADLLGGLVVKDLPPPSWLPALRSMAIGLLILLAFASGPLLHIRNVPALRVIRRDLGGFTAHNLAVYSPGFVVLGMLMLWQSGDLRLGAYTLGAIVTALLVLVLIATGSIRLLSIVNDHLNPTLQFGISAVTRQAKASALQSVACGLGISVLLLLAVVRGDLLAQWQASIPPRAPNHFVINVQPRQLSDLQAYLASHLTVSPAFYPMVRARLTAINGHPVVPSSYTSENARRLLAREFNLSWAENLGRDNQIVSGRWWSPGEHGSPVLSVEKGVAKTLAIRMDDSLQFRVAGREFNARVMNLRKVTWDSFEVNFFVLMPPGVLEEFPASYISAFYLPDGQSRRLDRLVAEFPNITVIDTSTVIKQVRSMVVRVIRAIEYVFLFTMAAGLIVLYAVLQSTLSERLRENAILRALGATRRQLQQRLLVEFVVLGLVAGATAAASASVAGYVLAEQVFHVIYSPGVWLWIAGCLAGVAGIGTTGYIGTRIILRQSPARTLREIY